VTAFLKLKVFETIVLTVPENDMEKVEAMLKSYTDSSEIALTRGGNSRQESVYNGLELLGSYKPDFVLIHDAARPWIKRDVIMHVLNGTLAHGACLPIIPVADALKEIDTQGFVVKNISRNSVYGAQTPQGFSFEKILTAHRTVRRKGLNGFIDDAEVYSQLYSPVFTVEGDKQNKKITYKSDIQ